MATMPLFKDVMRNYDVVFNKPFIQRITPAGWSVIVAGLIIIALSIWKIRVDNAERVSEIAQMETRLLSNFESSLRNQSLSYNRVTGEIKKDTSVIVNINETRLPHQEPFLNNVVDANIQHVSEDAILIGLSVRNVGKGVAIDIREDIFAISLMNGAYKWHNPGPRGSNEQFTMIPDDKYGCILNFKPFKNSNPDKIYVYFKMAYRNDLKQDKKPIRQIYVLPKPIAMGSAIMTANENEYNAVKSFLVREKLW